MEYFKAKQGKPNFWIYSFNKWFKYMPSLGTMLIFFKRPRVKRAQFCAAVRVKTIFGYRNVLIPPSQLKELVQAYNERMSLILDVSRQYADERKQLLENKANAK